LFGRLRTEARVRARVRPQAPPPKLDRRDRRRGGRRREGADDRTRPSAEGPSAGRDGAVRSNQQQDRGDGAGRRSPRQRGGTSRTNEGGDVDERRERERPELTADELAAQQEAVRAFLDGLLDAFGVEGTVTIGTGDDNAIEAAIDGEDVGLLLGPRGATLEAVQELARRALQQHSEDSARLRVDVGGYRQRRREALAKFATKVATQVRESGEAASLEPMGAADRKVVHDTVNDIDGVRTSSEGEEPRRRVVISPS
jgi:spoIIIJ-associated protein